VLPEATVNLDPQPAEILVALGASEVSSVAFRTGGESTGRSGEGEADSEDISHAERVVVVAAGLEPPLLDRVDG
jgi:hypothetical protein